MCRDQPRPRNASSVIRPCCSHWRSSIIRFVSDQQKQNETDGDDKAAAAKTGRFSLHGLSAAFARLTGTTSAQSPTEKVAAALDELQDASSSPGSEVLSPRMIVEGMLFVGNSEGRPITGREMAAQIRDVSPREIDTLVDELNTMYADNGTTYRIVGEGKGYRMRLNAEYDVVRQRLQGRVREAKLTTTAIEVLSIVAYRQPITADEVTRLRNGRSHAVLSQLVRRGLLSLERPAGVPRRPIYQTTDRFNRLFRVDSPQDLPSSEDLDDN